MVVEIHILLAKISGIHMGYIWDIIWWSRDLMYSSNPRKDRKMFPGWHRWYFPSNFQVSNFSIYFRGAIKKYTVYIYIYIYIYIYVYIFHQQDSGDTIWWLVTWTQKIVSHKTSQDSRWFWWFHQQKSGASITWRYKSWSFAWSRSKLGEFQTGKDLKNQTVTG